MVDWFLAERLATWVAGDDSGRRPRADLAAMARDSEERVVAYTGLVPQAPLPAPEGVERPEWVRANVTGMRALLDPVLRKAGGRGPLRPALRLAAGAALTAEVGILLGLMAQRVLGQYELVLLEAEEEELGVAGATPRRPRLLFVLPNLAGAVRSFGVPEEEFVRWVALHEVTHAVQFAGVPWLQPHLAGLVRRLLDAMELRLDDSRNFRMPDRDELRRMADALRRGDVLSVVSKPHERETIDRLQAAMAVVEGHAEHVMDAVGADVLPSLPQLRDALERRRRSASAPARLLGRLLGLEMKLRQYRMGKDFCDAVVREGGRERLAGVWSSPEALPTPDELAHPGAWLRRTATVM